jgi:hypothetical protein
MQCLHYKPLLLGVGGGGDKVSVATAAFWRAFPHDGKISPGWWGLELGG